MSEIVRPIWVGNGCSESSVVVKTGNGETLTRQEIERLLNSALDTEELNAAPDAGDMQPNLIVEHDWSHIEAEAWKNATPDAGDVEELWIGEHHIPSVESGIAITFSSGAPILCMPQDTRQPDGNYGYALRDADGWVVAVGHNDGQLAVMAQAVAVVPHLLRERREAAARESALRAERERLRAALENIIRNDRSREYEHHEKRPWDGKKPSEVGVGTRWLTPREIAKDALKERESGE